MKNLCFCIDGYFKEVNDWALSNFKGISTTYISYLAFFNFNFLIIYQRMLPFGGNGNQTTSPFTNFSVSPDHNRLPYELNSEDCNDRQFEIFFRGKKFLLQKSFKMKKIKIGTEKL